MRRVLPLVIACVLLSGCFGWEKGSVKPTSFGVSIDEVKGTSVTFTIHPNDEKAWYAYTVIGSMSEESAYGWTDAAIAENEFSSKLMSYDHYYSQEDRFGARFSDIFCYQGTRDFTERFLIPNCDYRIVVYQIDPYQRVLCGSTCSQYLSTLDIVYSDLTFDLQFAGDTLRIVPSDANATYFWDYEETDIVNEEYFDDYYYFRSLVYMYEDYDFMGNILSKGPDEWVFSRDDKNLREGSICSLTIAGYEGGEINTSIFAVRFEYHKDGSELLPETYDVEE